MPDQKRVMLPEHGYDIQVKIADLDYTNDINQVRIVSSITGAYQIVSITMLLDPNDIIRERIYGKEPIKMTIRYMGRGSVQAALEEVKFELIHLSSASASGGMQQSNTDKTKELKMMTFTTVPKEPFRTISTTVNDIFFGKTPKQIIQSLVSSVGAELIIDSEGENSEPIKQVLIPPTTLYNTILYIDNTFGIFDGACNLGFCQYDNKLYVMNLTKRLTKSQVFTVYQLSTNSKDTLNITEKSTEGNIFYTYFDVTSSYSGNSAFATNAMQVKHVFKPMDSLYRVYEQDMNKVCSEYGAISKNDQIDFNSVLSERESYRTTLVGNEKVNVVANARVARQIISLATITIKLERNLQVLNLLKVGEPVKFIPQTSEYVELSGKYLLKSSDITFTRQTRNWMSETTIVLCRTNKTI